MNGLWLKALTCLTLTDFPTLSADSLAEKLEAERFVPCQSIERERHGFTPAFEQESLARNVNGVFWVQIMSEVKPVPGSAVKRLLRERVAELELKEARRVGKKEQKELKEQIVDELVQKAVPVQSTLTVMLDPATNLMVVGSTSTKKVDLALKLLLKCVDGFNPAYMRFEKSVQGQMTELLMDEDSSIFATDSSLVLKGLGTPAPTVRFAKHSLAGPEVITHLNAGMRPISLELGWRDRLSFVLTEKLEIKGLNYLELVTSELESAPPEDPAELIDAMLMVQTGEVRAMLTDLSEWLGGPEKAGDAQPAAV
jgi:recombination associated protein RdgC